MIKRAAFRCITRLTRGAGAALLLACAARDAQAHHSGAMFDQNKIETITGTVRAFNWINPHVNVELVADAQPGRASAVWTLEGSSPGVMSRSGWSKRSMNPGDRVEATIAPLKDGGFGGSLRKVVLPDGRTLTWAIGYPPAAEPPH